MVISHFRVDTLFPPMEYKRCRVIIGSLYSGTARRASPAWSLPTPPWSSTWNCWTSSRRSPPPSPSSSWECQDSVSEDPAFLACFLHSTRISLSPSSLFINIKSNFTPKRLFFNPVVTVWFNAFLTFSAYFCTFCYFFACQILTIPK